MLVLTVTRARRLRCHGSDSVTAAQCAVGLSATRELRVSPSV